MTPPRREFPNALTVGWFATIIMTIKTKTTVKITKTTSDPNKIDSTFGVKRMLAEND